MTTFASPWSDKHACTCCFLWKMLNHFLNFKVGRKRKNMILHGSNYEVALGILWSPTQHNFSSSSTIFLSSTYYKHLAHKEFISVRSKRFTSAFNTSLNIFFLPKFLENADSHLKNWPKSIKICHFSYSCQ